MSSGCRVLQRGSAGGSPELRLPEAAYRSAIAKVSCHAVTPPLIASEQGKSPKSVT